MDTNLCWICAGKLSEPMPFVNDTVTVTCRTCGQYSITRSLYATVFPLPDDERHLMSYWGRQRTIDGAKIVLLNADSIKEIVSSLQRPPQWEKPDLFIASIAKLSVSPEKYLGIDWARDHSLACARTGNELRFHIHQLREQGILEAPDAATINLWRLTLKGWLRFNELHQTRVASRSAFVALRFKEEILALWAPGFAQAISDAGYTPERSGLPNHNERIDAEIIVQIKRSRFVVADSTFANPGVYFEAGFALALGLPVIWTCREDRHEEDMHFDTRQYNYILWRDAQDLKKQLTARILATI